MCIFRGQSSPISGYLVFQLPSWLQILHGQQVVHEVHVRGHLQEWSLRVDSRKARQQLLQIFHNLRADRKQDDTEVQLQFSLTTYIPKVMKLLSSAQFILFYFSTFLLNLYFPL